MRFKNLFLLAAVVLLTACSGVSRNLQAPNTLDRDTLDTISNAVFEVVTLKPVTDSMGYQRPLPVDALPFAERNDKYLPLGTAFAISPTEFVTAAHVTNLGAQTQYQGFFLRDKNGKIYGVDKILKYADNRDFVLFTLQEKTSGHFLWADVGPILNTKVYAIGNALGEGIVVRDGLYTSNTPEARNGEWKWLRFSAAASPGNSGGPLVDDRGRVVGVILRKSANENLNVALPIAEVIGAPKNSATIDGQVMYTLPNAQMSYTTPLKFSYQLPKSYRELDAELKKLLAMSNFFRMKGFFTANAGGIFPNGPGASLLLYQGAAMGFPTLVTKNDDGNWLPTPPATIKEAELPRDGHISYGTVADTLIISMTKPEDIEATAFREDSKLFMDLFLTGISMYRQIGSEKVKITSMGKAAKESLFTDFYGRKWQVRTWPVEYEDDKIIAFSLPVPGGCLTMLKTERSGSRNVDVISDLKVLANFIYAPYAGSLKQWREYLAAKELLPRAFSRIGIDFEYGKSFGYNSQRLSFTLPKGVMNVSERSHLTLGFGYFMDKGKPVWDVGAVSVSEDKSRGPVYLVARNLRPPKELNEKYQNEWNAIEDAKFPYNGALFYQDKMTVILAADPGKKNEKAGVIYSYGYFREGKAEQAEMSFRLDGFRKALTVHEDGDAAESAEDNGRAADKQSPEGFPFWEYAAADDRKLAECYDVLAITGRRKGEETPSVRDLTRAVDLDPTGASHYFLRAGAYQSKGEFAKAATDWRKGLELEPGNAPARGFYVQLLAARLKNLEDAERVLKKALEEVPGDGSRAAAYGAFLQQYGKRSVEAEALFRRALASSPNDAFVVSGAAAFFAKTPQGCDEAESLFRRALDLAPDNPRIAVPFAVFMASVRKNPRVADTLFRNAIAAHGKDADLLGDYALFLARTGDYRQAEDFYRRALEADTGQAKHLFNLARLLATQNKGDEAEKLYRRAIAAEPENVSVIVGLAGFLGQGKGGHDEATTLFKKALELEPENVAALIDYARFLVRTKKRDEAEACLRRALQADPQNGSVLFELAEFLRQFGKDHRETDQLYLKVVERSPDDARVLSGYAKFRYRAFDDGETAERYYRQALQVAPDDADILCDFASFMTRKRVKYEEGEKLFRQALGRAPNNARINTAFGNFLAFDLDKPEEAERRYAVAVGVAHPSAFSLAAYANYLANRRARFAEAEELYRRAAELNGGTASQSGNFAGMLLAMGRYEEGAKKIEESFAKGPGGKTLQLELWFYRYAHLASWRSRALDEVDRLLSAGVRSPHWNLQENVKRAVADGHPDPHLLRTMAEAINDKVPAEAWKKLRVSGREPEPTAKR